MTNARVNEIKNRMTAFENDKFTREEMLNEVFKLQNEMAVITFGEALSEGKRFYDIANHYSDMNREAERISTEKMIAFRRECSEATDCIRAEISGRKGESRTFEKLNYLISAHSLRKNIEIGNENLKTEIDALVVTEKAAFIIEVKNTKRDIFIDENGQYFRTGEFLKWDSDIGSKLALRETFVRTVAEKSGIHNLKIVKVVVFTDNRIRVQNRCKSIVTCFLNQLTSIVDAYKGEKCITIREIDSLMESIDEMTTITRYAPRFDFDKFKSDFAEIVAEMSAPEEPEVKIISWKAWKDFFSSISLRKVS